MQHIECWDVLKPLVFFAGLSSPAIFCMTLSTFSAVSGLLGLAVVTASPLIRPSVEFGSKVDRAAALECHLQNHGEQPSTKKLGSPCARNTGHATLLTSDSVSFTSRVVLSIVTYLFATS
jgi:hypothetical protein